MGLDRLHPFRDPRADVLAVLSSASLALILAVCLGLRVPAIVKNEWPNTRFALVGMATVITTATFLLALYQSVVEAMEQFQENIEKGSQCLSMCSCCCACSMSADGQEDQADGGESGGFGVGEGRGGSIAGAAAVASSWAVYCSQKNGDDIEEELVKHVEGIIHLKDAKEGWSDSKKLAQIRLNRDHLDKYDKKKGSLKRPALLAQAVKWHTYSPDQKADFQEHAVALYQCLAGGQAGLKKAAGEESSKEETRQDDSVVGPAMSSPDFGSDHSLDASDISLDSLTDSDDDDDDNGDSTSRSTVPAGPRDPFVDRLVQGGSHRGGATRTSMNTISGRSCPFAFRVSSSVILLSNASSEASFIIALILGSLRR